MSVFIDFPDTTVATYNVACEASNSNEREEEEG